MTPWERFTAFNFNQLEELSQFKPDLWWFDGDWEHKPEEWKSKEIKEKLLFWNPQTVVNSRLNQYGDYKTPRTRSACGSPRRCLGVLYDDER
ncbi:alpha-L-fucosidase [Capnocytophaga canimorsus]|nr:alpha-L-fucosidase [Capnocytophaga canimorsus]WGU68311.1 alpha-L-fucosidase [Capnocytophaga canimorsus]WGU70584.1 alpha-L-fucosidase [Capnocytophaga canimorsus]